MELDWLPFHGRPESGSQAGSSKCNGDLQGQSGKPLKQAIRWIDTTNGWIDEQSTGRMVECLLLLEARSSSLELTRAQKAAKTLGSSGMAQWSRIECRSGNMIDCILGQPQRIRSEWANFGAGRLALIRLASRNSTIKC